MRATGAFPRGLRDLTNRQNIIAALTLLGSLLALSPLTRAQQSKSPPSKPLGMPDPSGIVQTFSESGPLDFTGPFFQSLGTNGRSCATCHQPSDAMSVAAYHVQIRFEQSQGLDP